LSSLGRGRRRLAGALALVLVLPGAAAGLDVKLWPLFRYARDDARGLVRWSALGPLIEYTATPETREFRLRPLIAYRARKGRVHDDRAEILYPLLSTRWQDDYQSFRMLLFNYRTSPRPGTPHPPGEPPPAAAWPSRLALVPFVFYHHSPEEGSHLSVLPFWFDERGFLGWDRFRAIMFPAYVQLEEPGVVRTFTPFPFFSTVGGPLGDGVRVWPFYGRTDVAGREHSSYALWPFHIRSRRWLSAYGWEERRVDLPVHLSADGELRHTVVWGPFAYLHSIDERRGTEAIGAPWPLVFRERFLGEEAWHTWRLFPFYGRKDVGGRSNRFYAWPAYRRRAYDEDAFHYLRRDVGLLLWRSQQQVNTDSGHEQHLLTVIGAWRAEEDDGHASGQAPALLDSLLPRNRGILDAWAPLWAAWRWDTRPDGARDWSLLWGLVAREDGRLRGPWYLEHDGG
jgi:hypothetical protein